MILINVCDVTLVGGGFWWGVLVKDFVEDFVAFFCVESFGGGVDCSV